MTKRFPVGGRRSIAGFLLILFSLARCGDGTGPTPTTAPASATATSEPRIDVAETLGPIIDVPEPTPQPTPSGIDNEQQATIYGVVVRDLLTASEASVGGFPTFVGISPETGQGELLDTSTSEATLPGELIGQLADLGTTVAFIPFTDAVGALEDGGVVRENGVYLTLGTLIPDQSGGYQVYASYYHAIDDAAGYSYVLTHEGNAWTIKERKETWQR